MKSLTQFISTGYKQFTYFYREEFKHIFSDPGVMLIFIGAIVAYPILTGYIYSKEVLRDVPAAMVDLCQSSESRQLIRMVDATESLAITSHCTSLEEAKALFEKGKVNAIMVIPATFSRDVLSGKQTTVSAYCDGAYFLTYKQAFKGFSYATGTFSAGIELKKMTAKGTPLNEALKQRDPIPVKTFGLFNSTEGYATFIMAPFSILVLQQTLLIGIGLIGGTHREKGTLQNLLPHGIKRGMTLPVIFGKTACYLTIYLFNSLYVMVVIYKLFRFPHHAYAFDLAIYMVPFLLAVIFLGLTFATFYKNREHVMLLLIFISIPFLFFSGISWPYEALPIWLKSIANLIPSTPGIRGFLKLNQMGAPLSAVTTEMLHLWGLVLLYFATAVMGMRYTITKSLKIHN
jgi:ABC-2 type transport system permease protein